MGFSLVSPENLVLVSVLLGLTFIAVKLERLLPGLEHYLAQKKVV